MDFLRKRLPAQVGRYLEGVEFPARKEELLGGLQRNGVPGPIIGQLRKRLPEGRVPWPSGRLGRPAREALTGSSFPQTNFLELRDGEVRRMKVRRTGENSPFTSFGDVGVSSTPVGGRKRKLRIFEPSQAFNTPLTMPLKNPRFLCRPSATLSRAPERRLKGLCSRGADSRRPRGPNRQDDGSNRLLYTPRSGRAGFLYQTGGVNS